MYVIYSDSENLQIHLMKGQCLWMIIILLVQWDITCNSWLTGLLHYNARQFISLLYMCGNVDF